MAELTTQQGHPEACSCPRVPGTQPCGSLVICIFKSSLHWVLAPGSDQHTPQRTLPHLLCPSLLLSPEAPGTQGCDPTWEGSNRIPSVHKPVLSAVTSDGCQKSHKGFSACW